MHTPTTFTSLRSKLEEWKANDLLMPAPELSWMRFQKVAAKEILPVLQEAEQALASAGLEVSITEADETTRTLGLYVLDVGLLFWPAEDARTVHFLARRFSDEGQGHENRFRYAQVQADPLRTVVEEALLRLLGPRQAYSVNR